MRFIRTGALAITLAILGASVARAQQQSFPPQGGVGSGGSSGQYSTENEVYTAGTYWISPGGGQPAASGAGAQASVQVKAPVAGTYSGFCVTAGTAPTGSNTIVFTWYGGSSGSTAEPLTVTVSASVPNPCDLTHSFPVSQGDLLSIQAVVTGGTTTTTLSMLWATPGAAGPAGAAGNTVLNGSGVPSSGTGNNGDFYINLSATPPTLYGPKAAGAWPGSPIGLNVSQGVYSYCPPGPPTCTTGTLPPSGTPISAATHKQGGGALIACFDSMKGWDACQLITDAASPTVAGNLTPVYSGTPLWMVIWTPGGAGPPGMPGATGATGAGCSTLGGDLGGTCSSATVLQVNGAVVPASAPGVKTNGSRQLLTQTAADVVGEFTGGHTSSAYGLATDGSQQLFGGGSVTVVGGGNLASIAVVTGGGAQTAQTPSATTTLDTSGNFSTPGTGTFGVGSGVAGGLQLSQGTASTPAANTVLLQAPTSVTAYSMTVPGTGGTGFILNTNVSSVDTWTFVGFNGTGNVVRATAVPSVQSCGTTSTCSQTALSSPQIVTGSVALVSGTPSTATITGISPAFTSASTYFCTLGAQSSATGALLSVANVSGSSFTITGPAAVTTVINYLCAGN